MFFFSSRQRRSCTEPYILSRFIELVKKIEEDGLFNTTEEVAAYLRRLSYDKLEWSISCGSVITDTLRDFGVLDDTINLLNNTEKGLLKAMLQHSSNSTTGLEVGVTLTDSGDTIVLSHVVTAISCAGFNRDTHLTSAALVGLTKKNIDNLFQTSFSGDIGQTTILHYAYPDMYPLLGPSGKWNDISCPKVYHLKGMSSSELTDAEILGDLDGVILATIILTIKKKPLSEILYDYYEGSGVLDAGGRKFKASDRVATFGELIPDHELEAQSVAFTESYYNAKTITKWKKRFKGILKLEWRPVDFTNGTSRAYILNKVPSTVQDLYKKLYKTCPGVLKTKYTINYFVSLVKQLERETTFGIADMTRTIVIASEYSLPWPLHSKHVDYTYTSGFSWYVIREMLLHRFANRDGKRELGVIDAGGDTVAVGPVLAGLAVGANYKTNPFRKTTNVALTALHTVTVTGILASAAYSRARKWRPLKEIMGMTGVWVRSSCPPKYRLKKQIKVGQHTSRAELLGGIDGLVLGKRVSRWLAAEPRLKLSNVLESYYGAGYKSVSSQDRLDQFYYIFPTKGAFLQQLSQQTRLSKPNKEHIAKTFYNTMFPSRGKRKTDRG